ncbi:MAG: hypothetical protein ACE5IJ_04835 [Thermoplasmata archaeon]
MSSEVRRRFRGPTRVAYILAVLGVAMIPLGIGLTLIRVCDISCSFIYMQQGLISVGVGLFVIFFSILLFFIPTEVKSETLAAAQAFHCPRCGRPTSWVAPEKRWFCHFCQDYASAEMPAAQEPQ